MGAGNAMQQTQYDNRSKRVTRQGFAPIAPNAAPAS